LTNKKIFDNLNSYCQVNFHFQKGGKMVTENSTGRKAILRENYTDCSETNITVRAGTTLPIITFEPDRVQCLAQGQDGGCPIWVPRTAVEIKK